MGWEGDYFKNFHQRGAKLFGVGGGGRLIMVIGMSGVQFSL